MSDDPAVRQAQELWRNRQAKDAMLVLVKRINELKQTKPPSKERGSTLILGGFVFGAAITAAVGAILLATGVLAVANKDENPSSDQVIAAAPTPTGSSDTLTPSEQRSEEPTAIPTIQPQPTAIPASATPDCGARDWWLYNAGHLIDWMDHFTRVRTKILPYASSGGDDLAWAINYDAMDELKENVKGSDYPLCVKEARDMIINGLVSYSAYLGDEYYADLGLRTSIDEDWLANGIAYMEDAASLIYQLTGEDASFLIVEYK